MSFTPTPSNDGAPTSSADNRVSESTDSQSAVSQAAVSQSTVSESRNSQDAISHQAESSQAVLAEDAPSEPESAMPIEPESAMGAEQNGAEPVGTPEQDGSSELVGAPEPEEVPEPHSGISRVPRLLQPAFERRGFDDLTEVQRAVLDTEAEGRDLQIFSQTGSGKTVALGFVLAKHLVTPPKVNGPEALIIVPTRELATQVCEELRWLLADLPDMEVLSVTGGHPVHLDRRALSRRPRVLVGTPGRLLDHIGSGVLNLGDVRELVLDEADQMLDMGFREELEGILDATPPERGTHLVSATFPDAIRRLAQRYQREPLVIEGTRLGEANADIEHTGHLVRHHERYDVIVSLLIQGDGERTLIFVERRSDAVEVAELLEADGFAALPLSGELAQGQRERTLSSFRDGKAKVLVATDVAARGLDVPDVAMVIHTAPPIDAQTYTHRSGRTGRAGKQGRSVLLAPPNRRRRVDGLLYEAGVQLRWQKAPDPNEVRAEQAARVRAKLEAELLEQLSGKKASLVHIKQAKRLLETQEATDLVAALLERLDPVPKPQAPARRDDRRDDQRGGGRGRDDYGRGDGRRDDRGQSGRGYGDRNQGDRGYGDRSYGDRNQSYGDRNQSYGERNRGDRRFPDRRGGSSQFGGGPSGGGRFPQGDRGQRPSSSPGAVRFFMNYGSNQGATPGRLLASVCRRGNVQGSDIGSIAIHPNASTFDVSADIAENFERDAGRRDARDPKVLIRRDRGPAPRH